MFVVFVVLVLVFAAFLYFATVGGSAGHRTSGGSDARSYRKEGSSWTAPAPFGGSKWSGSSGGPKWSSGGDKGGGAKSKG